MSKDYHYEVVPRFLDLDSALRQLKAIMQRGPCDPKSYLELRMEGLENTLTARQLLEPLRESLEPISWESKGNGPKDLEIDAISKSFFETARAHPTGFYSLWLYGHFRCTPRSKQLADLSYLQRDSRPSVTVLYGPGTARAGVRRRLLEEVFRQLDLLSHWERAWETLSIGTNLTPVPPIPDMSFPEVTVEPGGIDHHGASQVSFVPRAPDTAITMFNKLRSRLVDKVDSYVITIDGGLDDIRQFAERNIRAGQVAVQTASTRWPVGDELVTRLDRVASGYSISWRVGPVAEIEDITFSVELRKTAQDYRLGIEFWMGAGTADEEMERIVGQMRGRWGLKLRFLEIN